MAENFDLIFGQNASQQYAWNDTDYQNGWEAIGNIPPTAAQFDALQRKADMKSQELNSRLLAVEQSIAGGGSQKREPDTEYAVGTILTYDDLPIDWVLECIVGGISSTNDITIPSPRVEGARILDGTVTWALRKIATYSDVGYRQSSTACASGSIAFSTALPAGWYLECTTGGKTSSGELTISTPTVGGTVSDGTVTWTIRKMASTDAATSSTFGVVKIGSNIDNNDGTISISSSNVQSALGFNPATRDAATTSNAGLMSTSDKTKLNGIDNGANNYSLPAATGSTRGGVTIGSNISLSGDKISLTSGNVTNALGYTPPRQDTTYGVVNSSTNGLMTPAMLALLGSGGGIVAASLTANGYVKFANGWIVQWGMFENSEIVNFPITFPHETCALTMAIKYNHSYSGYMAITSLTQSGFTPWQRASGLYRYYIAVGH